MLGNFLTLNAFESLILEKLNALNPAATPLVSADVTFGVPVKANAIVGDLTYNVTVSTTESAPYQGSVVVSYQRRNIAELTANYPFPTIKTDSFVTLTNNDYTKTMSHSEIMSSLSVAFGIELNNGGFVDNGPVEENEISVYGIRPADIVYHAVILYNGKRIVADAERRKQLEALMAAEGYDNGEVFCDAYSVSGDTYAHPYSEETLPYWRLECKSDIPESAMVIGVVIEHRGLAENMTTEMYLTSLYASGTSPKTHRGSLDACINYDLNIAGLNGTMLSEYTPIRHLLTPAQNCILIARSIQEGVSPYWDISFLYTQYQQAGESESWTNLLPMFVCDIKAFECELTPTAGNLLWGGTTSVLVEPWRMGYPLSADTVSAMSTDFDDYDTGVNYFQVEQLIGGW